MKKFFLIALMLISANVFAQNINQVDMLKEYYRLLETKDGLRDAYYSFQRDITYEKFLSLYKDVAWIYVGKIINTTCSTFNYTVVLAEFKNKKDYSDLQESYYDVTVSIDNPGPGMWSLNIIKSTPIKCPYTKEEMTLIRYYNLLERRETIALAYEMSTKAYPYDTYKNWYNYDQAYANIVFLEKKGIVRHVFVSFDILRGTDLSSYDKYEYSMYDVEITANESRILSSTSNSIYDKDMGVIKKFLLGSEDERALMLGGDLKLEDLKNYPTFNNIIEESDMDSIRWIPRAYRQYESSNSSPQRYIKIVNDRIVSYSEYWVEHGGKPVIYLYPKENTKINVTLTPQGKFTITEPLYKNGWYVSSTPNSEITNISDGKKYPYLFWEAEYYDMKKPEEGFLVKQSDLDSFFTEKLNILGLNEKEISDFKEFWIKTLVDFPYYKISFIPQSELDRVFPLTISPKPDSIIRVYFVHKGLKEKIEVKTQDLKKVQRFGYSAIEWGGTLP